MREFIVSKCRSFNVRTCEQVETRTVVRIDAHRRPRYSRLSVAVVTDGDTLACEMLEWYGVRCPVAFGEVSAMVERVESVASAAPDFVISADNRKNTVDALALACALTY